MPSQVLSACRSVTFLKGPTGAGMSALPVACGLLYTGPLISTATCPRAKMDREMLSLQAEKVEQCTLVEK